jgi:ElaB/YqjD/DUF883 family membrane-anchored ribosome-binding protein
MDMRERLEFFANEYDATIEYLEAQLERMGISPVDDIAYFEKRRNGFYGVGVEQWDDVSSYAATLDELLDETGQLYRDRREREERERKERLERETRERLKAIRKTRLVALERELEELRKAEEEDPS